ncbi:uncharacterized protein E0L32_003036 [Thyridium curvatum]|uniref:CoA-binding domain-containing protein n=1 Tax=Thyridium curvatum TaxID=1093900 RepID=A0A507BCX7_9PEZI|nr:uncharacterized protein E0L32_003036 [Thyridium curvatum]TPX17393.1 hypothetical protein E0L32_003036 [Thyridium curvatum]
MLPRPSLPLRPCRSPRSLPRLSGTSQPTTLPRRAFSATGPSQDYASTLKNLRIGKHTRVMFQGFTGKLATANAAESIAWGTNVVGGVTPGRTGEHLGLPLLPTVQDAVERLRPDVTGIYVAAHQDVPGAVEEAVAAEVPLVVAVAEHIPLHDMLRVHAMLKTQSRSRLVGANSPGVISATGRCRVGFQPLPCFAPGKIGVAAKSGTLSYECVASTTRAGLGQSLCIGVGGDILPGTDLREALMVLAEEEDTEGIALIGEIGGWGEMEAAQWIKEYNARTANPKPIVGLIGGVHAAPGRVMGHAGAFTVLGEPDARANIAALEAAGVTMVNHPSKIGDALKARLAEHTKTTSGGQPSSPFKSGVQQRGIHTAVRRARTTQPRSPQHQQKRHLYIREDQAFDLLRQYGVTAAEYSGKGTRRFLAISIDRSTRSPCIVASPTTEPDLAVSQTKRFPFDYNRGLDGLQANRIAEHLKLGPRTGDSLRKVLGSLAAIFYDKEAFLLETRVVERLGEVKIVNARFGFDDAAHRTANRQADIHALRDPAAEDPAEVEAERDAIVLIRLGSSDDRSCSIGTVVNGAGLAMNTLDALADAGGRAANFLDTGGKATSETVKKSFELVLRDERVRVIFVNIFGGLTRGDMIARGVVLAFEELRPRVPVVVRIRGTNEAEGQRIIAESGLPIYAFDDFEEAAAKAIELSGQ